MNGLKFHEYIGDGVYASTDGYHVMLHLGHHEAEPLVGLEPEVLAALNTYAKSLPERFKREAEGAK